MSRTLPMECEHGVIVDWGDFGPCQDCDEHDGEDCPNFADCEECEAERARWVRVPRDEVEGLRAELDEVAELNTAAVAENTELRSRLAAAEFVCETLANTYMVGGLVPLHGDLKALHAALDAWRAVQAAESVGEVRAGSLRSDALAHQPAHPQTGALPGSIEGGEQ